MNSSRFKNTFTLKHIFADRDVRKKIFATIGLVILYRLLTYIPLPGVGQFNPDMIEPGAGDLSLVTGFVNLFSGGAYYRLSILALGFLPVFAANGLIKGFINLIPSLKNRLEEEPYEARRKLPLWQKILVAPLALLQTYLLFFSSPQSCFTRELAISPFSMPEGVLPVLTVFTCATAGAYVAMFIAEWIDQVGFSGTGYNAIIFSGAAIMLPAELYSAWLGPQGSGGQTILDNLQHHSGNWLAVGVYLALMIVGILYLNFLLNAKRNVPVLHPGRYVGSRPSMPVHSSLPISFSLSWTGLTSAQSLVSLPLLVTPFLICSSSMTLQRLGQGLAVSLSPESLWSAVLLYLTVIIFGPLVAEVEFDAEKISKNLKMSGVGIPGIERGRATENYLVRVFHRINLLPTLISPLVLLIPWFINALFDVQTSILAGEGLYLIVVFIDNLYMEMDAKIKLTDIRDIHWFANSRCFPVRL